MAKFEVSKFLVFHRDVKGEAAMGSIWLASGAAYDWIKVWSGEKFRIVICHPYQMGKMVHAPRVVEAVLSQLKLESA